MCLHDDMVNSSDNPCGAGKMTADDIDDDIISCDNDLYAFMVTW